jgi:hypothetical protein
MLFRGLPSAVGGLASRVILYFTVASMRNACTTANVIKNT